MNYNNFFYNKLINKKYKNNHQLVGWGSKKSQLIRFKQLIKQVDLNNKSLLDVGCGLADLKTFLSSKNIKTTYSGIDLNRVFISKCRKKFSNTQFILGDFSSIKFSRKYDVVVQSGMLNLPSDNQDSLLKKIITKMFKLSKKCCVVNFLTNKAKSIHTNQVYINLNKQISFIEQMTPFYFINKSYMTHDVTIFLYHDKQ